MGHAIGASDPPQLPPLHSMFGVKMTQLSTIIPYTVTLPLNRREECGERGGGGGEGGGGEGRGEEGGKCSGTTRERPV